MIHYPHSPRHRHVEQHRAAGKNQAGEQVPAHYTGCQTGQVLASVKRALPLHPTNIRAARRAYLAVAPLLIAYPFVGIIAVQGFVVEGIIFAVRIVSAANVLDYTRVAVVRQPLAPFLYSPLYCCRTAFAAARLENSLALSTDRRLLTGLRRRAWGPSGLDASQHHGRTA